MNTFLFLILIIGPLWTLTRDPKADSKRFGYETSMSRKKAFIFSFCSSVVILILNYYKKDLFRQINIHESAVQYFLLLLFGIATVLIYFSKGKPWGPKSAEINPKKIIAWLYFTMGLFAVLFFTHSVKFNSEEIKHSVLLVEFFTLTFYFVTYIKIFKNIRKLIALVSNLILLLVFFFSRSDFLVIDLFFSFLLVLAIPFLKLADWNQSLKATAEKGT